MTALIRRSSPEGRVKSGRKPGIAQPQDVLTFWFGPGEPVFRKQWFSRDEAFDSAIRSRFLATVEAAFAGGLEHWASEPTSLLALVIVLDQLPRNLFRGTARAFAGDAAARRHAETALERGWARQCPPLQQLFLYLPFEHSEALADQDRAVALMGPWQDQTALAGFYDYALRHRAAIRQFGRFPHRNAALGRETQPREADWLVRHGGF